MATPNYTVDYNDERLTAVNDEKQVKLNESDTNFNNMIKDSETFYQGLNDKLDQSKAEQEKIINQQTDFAIKQIEQQQEQAEKDYIKEQSAAYGDYIRESDKYGANAEQRAAVGMGGSGYSESSMTKYYTTYQNRVATAREAIERAKLNYSNQITEAKLHNSSLLAELARDTLQQQLEYSIQGFQYKNTLVLEKANKRLEIESLYYSKWRDVLGQINTENALAEEVRQYNESLAAQKAYQNAQLKLERDKFNYQKQKDAASSAKITKGGSVSTGNSGKVSKNSTKSSYESNKNGVNKNTSGFTGKTYEEAVAYLKKNGVASSYASNVMTKGEWSRRKASYKQSGVGGAAAAANSYTDYLNTYVEYAVENYGNKNKTAQNFGTFPLPGPVLLDKYK